jgi:hypothetical protein
MQVQKENFDSEMKSRAAEIAAKDRLLLPAPTASAADHKAICARASRQMLTAAMQNNREPVQEGVRVEQPADKPCVRGAHDTHTPMQWRRCCCGCLSNICASTALHSCPHALRVHLHLLQVLLHSCSHAYPVTATTSRLFAATK